MESFENFKSEKLLRDSVSEILKYEDYERYRRWLQAKLSDYTGTEVLALEQPQALHGLAAILSREIWNAVPLPGNDFRPLPLTAPGRNEPCLCRSGKKYKKCCAMLPPPPRLPVRAMWPLVLEQLPRDTVQQLLVGGKVPIESLMEKAEEFRRDRKFKKALSLLEPLFDGHPAGTDRTHEFALDTVFNLYDDLNYHGKKKKLIQRVIETAPPSPLRASAYQRLATIRMDQGDISGAWETFQKARHDDPDNPMIGVLEVHLLMGEGRTEEARERAKFLLRRHRKLGDKDTEPHMEYLIKASRDPAGALADMTFAMVGGSMVRLKEWLERVADRPVPLYKLEGDLPDADIKEGSLPDFELRMRKAGIPRDQIAKMRAAWEAQAETLAAGQDDPEAAKGESTHFLVPPSQIEVLEDQWQEIFPLDKPFSVNPFPFDDGRVWDSDAEDEWVRFLEHHPAAFDSLEILDDVATAVFIHPDAGLPAMEELVLEPLLLRARAIIDRVLEESPGVRLDWGFLENRPPLRLLARLISHWLERDHAQEAVQLSEQMLELNPGDSHGFRSLVMNHRIRSGEDRKALELSDRYPDDGHVELLYGRVLALYRLGRTAEAEKAAQEAAKLRPKVVRYLRASRVRQPKVYPDRVTVGGDDEAWFYREGMREVWMATPGMAAWLKKIASKKGGRK
jgi:tetratricopeptide (TPR) repeat protein